MHKEELIMSKVCPKCNKEFDDDVTLCPDCQVELVAKTAESPAFAEKQEDKQVSVFSLTSEDSAQRVIEYMKEQGVDGEYRYSLRERTFKIYVAQSDARNALRACTAFYAIEAKRLKEEEDKRRAAEEAEKRRIEEEERKKREEEERIRREAEEKERKRREAEEAARKAAEEEAIRKAEEESRRKAEEAERIRREAEAATRKAEEAAKKLEEEAKRAAEEEARRKAAEQEAKRKAAEEEARRKAAEEEAAKLEEERKRQEAREKRKKMFEAGFREAEEQKQEERRQKFNFIPHVEGETVQEEASEPVAEEVQPESGPIFVETEPVDEYEVGDTIVVDAVEIESNDIAVDDLPDFDNGFSETDTAEQEENEAEAPLFSDFLSNIKVGKNIGGSLFGGTLDDEDEDEDAEQPAAFDDTSKSSDKTESFEKNEAVAEEDSSPVFSIKGDVKPKKPLVEDMFTDNMFSSAEKNDAVAKPNASGRNDAATESKDTIEEVINYQLKSSSAPSKPRVPEPPKSKFSDFDDALGDGTYKGFVPDYHQEEEKEEEDEDTLLAKSYGFNPEEYKKLKEKTAQKAEERKKNPPKKINKDFIVTDDSELDEYRGFVPDYSSKDEEEKMQYYTKRTAIDYSKYRSSSESGERNSLTNLSATLRSTSPTELSRIFENDILKAAAKPQDYIALKSSTYLIALTGGQLNSLLSAWLMTNCTSATVRQYAKDGATADENYNSKVDGIKNLIKQNFGKLDDAVLDIIVKKFYNKYLDE